MKKIDFLKMHGCGNDFIVFDDRANRFDWDDLARLARQHCRRRFAIGADGIIAVGSSAMPGGREWPAGADYEMRYVNHDGSIAEMCGNGIRCLGKFAAEELGDTREELKVLTGNGLLPIRLHRREDGTVDEVTVSMGVPRLAAEEIPTTLGNGDGRAINAKLKLGGEKLHLTGVNMGNPHAVIFVDRITAEHVHGLGPQIEKDEHFPERTNVEFVEVTAPDRLRMRVWERGVGETWACGTGACASVVAAVLGEKSEHGLDVTVELNGGDLSINWPGRDSPVIMRGPAETAFRGSLEF